MRLRATRLSATGANFRAASSSIRLHEWVGSLPGVAYDFTSAGGLTQDRGGLTAVSAAAQSIGLAHDYARASSGWVSGTDLLGGAGGFDSATGWTQNVGWSITGGVATKTPSATSSTLFFGTEANDLRAFVVKGTVSGRTAGSLQLQLGGSSTASESVSSNGEFARIVVKAAGSSGNFIVTANTTFDGSIDNLTVSEITGNPLLAPTDARRPTWGAMANGLPCSVWDGTRAMATAAPITWDTDEITVMAAVRSLANADEIIAELSANWTASNGTAILYRATPGGYAGGSRGTANLTLSFQTSGFPQPDTALLVVQGNITAPRVQTFRNGTGFTAQTGSQGTGNYGAHILNIGARNAASPSLFFNGEYARILAIGGNPTAEQYAAWLAWTAQGFATS